MFCDYGLVVFPLPNANSYDYKVYKSNRTIECVCANVGTHNSLTADS